MDNLTPAQRSQAMRAVKSKDSFAELEVRRVCRALGEPGYRLHRSDLPGTPDLSFLGRRLAIFVNGCFWHGHACPAGAKVPKTNSSYWWEKIIRNHLRDIRNRQYLAALGWRTLTVWECEVHAVNPAIKKLRQFLRRSRQ